MFTGSHSSRLYRRQGRSLTVLGNQVEEAATSRIRRWLPFFAGVLILDVLLLLPNHPGAMTLEALTLLPLELPPLILLLFFAPIGPRQAIARTLAILFSVITALKALDFLTFLSYDRAFSPVLDLHLAVAAWNLSRDSFGLELVLLAATAAIIALIAIGWIAGWAGRQIMAAGSDPLIQRPALVMASGLLVLFVASDTAKRFGDARMKTEAFTTRIMGDHIKHVYLSVGDLHRFRTEAAKDPFAALPPGQVLSGLKGRDVLMFFVESYGRTTLDNPLYADTTKSALEDFQRTIEARGLAARSAWLTSPVLGGQSWLAHASMLSGLWINNQQRYDALLASKRGSLINTFSDAGWDSVAVMPAITKGWPEGSVLGYDRIYNAKALDYKGTRFNWVTMPDQFTLSRFYRRELSLEDRPPLFAEIAMISSHAPWTPVAPVIDWAEIGDGSVFDKWANSGDPPSVVWLNNDRIRDQFRKSIDYVLRTLNAFTAEKLGADRLMIVLGDHQPAPLITGPDAGHDVPIHIIGPPELIAALDGWQWSEGITPDERSPVWSMKDFRDKFLWAFTPK